MNAPEPGLQRLLAEAPYVRLLARQLIADEADDAEQQAWLQAIQHGGERVATPRVWLARIVRNVATSLHRLRAKQRRRQDHARPAATDVVPSSAELMQQEEQRRLLVAAVDGLPEPLRAVVLLRYFEGLLPQAIAVRLGAPVTTVWNRLRRALQVLRERLDADHGGDRRAWLVPLVPFAARGDAASFGAVATTGSGVAMAGIGVMAMTMKTKLVAAVVAVLMVAGILWNARDVEPTPIDSATSTGEAVVAVGAALPRDVYVPVAGVAPREAVTTSSPSTATKGTLAVRIRFVDDKTPAAQVLVHVRPGGADPRTAGCRGRTDAAGVVVFAALTPANYTVTSDRFTLDQVDVRGGATAELAIELDAGVVLTGTVVDGSSLPVAGATIELRSLASSEDAEPLATSDAAGRFTVRAAPPIMIVGARAAAHAASDLVMVFAKDGATADVRLQLGPAAGRVDGLVVDGDALPVAGALVCVGDGPLTGQAPQGSRARPLPASARTDELGRFAMIGVAPGMQPVQARADGFASWRGECEVVANLGTPMRIVMARGGSVRGHVRTALGEAAAGVTIRVGELADLHRVCTFTAPDGSFELVAMPIGEVVVHAQHTNLGNAEASVRTDAGAITTCELRLEVGVELHGRVRDEGGNAVAKAYVMCEAKGAGPEWGDTVTDGDGRFVMRNCPAGEPVHVTVRAAGREQVDRSGVDPRRGVVELTMHRAVDGSARITGIVTAPDGRPLAGAMALARRIDATDARTSKSTGPDGRFVIDRVVPGNWRVVIRASDFPPLPYEAHTLGANAVWDMGTVVLREGGDARVAVDGDRAGMVVQSVGGNGEPRTDWPASDGGFVCRGLLPGPHRLLVSGSTIAAQAILFDVHAGRMTEVAVKLGPGTRQCFTIAPPAIEPLPRRVALTVWRGGELLRTTGVALTAGQATVDATWLAPGAYTVTVVDGQRQLANAPFTVGAAEGPPVQLTLQ